jgi:type VI secretion system secreted protein VgrG
MPPTQRDRTLSVSTPLGEDVLLVRSMTGRERLAAPFEYELDLVSDDIEVAPTDLLGKTATVALTLSDGGRRFFNGYINRFSQVGFDGASAIYRATLVPWLWFLSRTADCRIFQEKSVPDIVKEIFREHGLTDFEERLSGSYRQWTYCVQYRETDLNFVDRMLEQEGIYYFFQHQDGKHLLILADGAGAHSPVPGYAQIPYYPPDDTAASVHEHLDDWTMAQQVRPGAFVNTAFDFTAPRKDLLATRSSPKSHELADFEVFDYAGDYTEHGDGDTYSRIRLEETQAQHELVQAEGNARGLAAGALFNLTGYRREDQNREYLVVSSNYHIQSDLFGSSAAGSGGPVYRASLTAIPSAVPYRPPRTTPKPVVQGPQTAIVTGKAGEEIWTDQYGRVKVQFHWDRYGKHDENSSCWVRVSHPWAGKGWGSISVPRIGQEVIVEFLEGDPDQPIITGRVYNGDSMPPFGLPGGAVVSGIKSNTHKGKGYNELTMDDTAGKEKITIHGQYDMNTTVEHDQTNTVNNDFTETIKNNAKISIVQGTYSHDVQANTAKYHVQGALTETYDATQTTKVKQAIAISSTSGPISISSDSQHVYINAGTNIQLHVGSSMIWMDSGGQINIQGVNVALNGSSSVVIKGGIVHSEAQSEHQTKGAIVLSEGSATNTVKGGMVMLNP